MNNKVFISCAVTGSGDTASKHPDLPKTPEQIAKASIEAAKAGAVVIDNTSQYRYDEDIPLVVPECNASRIADHTNRGIIANPNCSTIQLVVACKPIQDAIGIERINVSTYQSVSGAGRLSMEALTQQSQALLAKGNATNNVQAGQEKPIAFNAVPKIGPLLDSGYTQEEMKMVWETQKIFEDPDIRVNPTCVRIPVYLGHSEAVHMETRTKLTVKEAHELLSSAPGVTVLDGDGPGVYPSASLEAAYRDVVFVFHIAAMLFPLPGVSATAVQFQYPEELPVTCAAIITAGGRALFSQTLFCFGFAHYGSIVEPATAEQLWITQP